MKIYKSLKSLRIWLLPIVCLLFIEALTVALCHVAIAEQPEVDARKDTLEAHAEELFALEVLPLLRTKCFGCHGEGDELRGEYYMTSRDALVRGYRTDQLHYVSDLPHIAKA